MMFTAAVWGGCCRLLLDKYLVCGAVYNNEIYTGSYVKAGSHAGECVNMSIVILAVDMDYATINIYFDR